MSTLHYNILPETPLWKPQPFSTTKKLHCNARFKIASQTFKKISTNYHLLELSCTRWLVSCSDFSMDNQDLLEIQIMRLYWYYKQRLSGQFLTAKSRCNFMDKKNWM